MSRVVARHRAHAESIMGSNRLTAWTAVVRWCALLTCLLAGLAGEAHADEIVQGVLQLRWGDAPRAPNGKAPLPPQFEAWLDAGPGARYPLDVAQARRAAGDLYALSNRRVAVSYVSRSHAAEGGKMMAASTRPTIGAIVPADRVPQRATTIGADGRVMASAPTIGSTRWVTLMCKFADVAAEPRPRAYFQSQYGDAPGQLGHYWSDVSYGAIDLEGSSAHGWYTLPKPKSAYVGLFDGRLKADLSRLFADCTAQADAEVAFDGVQGINLMFNEELDGSAWGGGACATLDGSYRCTRSTWNPPWSFNNLAPLAHEMGHGYGLPHSDNSDGDGDTYDNPWDLMSDAWRRAVTDTTYGLLPKQLNMYQRERLGWVAAGRKRIVVAENHETHEVMLDVAGLHDAGGVQLLVLAMPAQPDPFRTVIYTLEARRREGLYDGALAGNAVIVHRIEDGGIARSVDVDVPAADLSGNEGSMLKVGERWTTPDGRHGVQVVAEMARGFVVRVGPPPRAMSAPTPALVQNEASAHSSVAVRSAARPSSSVARRATVPAVRQRGCGIVPRALRLPLVCALLAR
jgi:M6 family metalloprotease-like protein